MLVSLEDLEAALRCFKSGDNTLLAAVLIDLVLSGFLIPSLSPDAIFLRPTDVGLGV